MSLPNKTRRPFSVTLLAVLVLMFAVVNLMRFFQTLRQWDFLASLLPFSPTYLAASGFVWSVGGLILAWGLWRGKPWSVRYTLLSMILYIMYYWLDRIVFANHAARVINWPFILAVTVSLLVWTWWVLSRHKNLEFFGVMHEQ